MPHNKNKLAIHYLTIAALSLSFNPTTVLAVTVNDSGANGVNGQPGGNSIADAGFSTPNTDASNSASSSGGTGGDGTDSVPGGTGGNSIALANATGAGNVSAFASATGGAGGFGSIFPGDGVNGGNGGEAIARANATSTMGGDVTVTVKQTGGAAGGSDGIGTLFGAGFAADSTLNNAVTGSTSGFLNLSQTAVGGKGGQTANFASSGGPATSRLLIVDTSAAKLTLTSNAIGGEGGQPFTRHGVGGNGGGATASAFGSSLIGADVTVNVSQTGGSGDFAAQGGGGASSILNNAATGFTSGYLSLSQTAVAGNGGDSIGESIAGGAGNASSTFDIDDSLAKSLTLNNTAIGGKGGDNTFGESFTVKLGNDGGNATTQSRAVSTLNSQVTITDYAQAGNGGNGGGIAEPDSFQEPRITNGGNASSKAIGQNAGDQSVLVGSTATAGNSGSFPNDTAVGGKGGDALAYASATSSLGHTSAISSAHAGDGVNLAGTANSQALANGGLGSQASALATRTGIRLNAKANVDNQSAGISDALATIGQSLPTPGSRAGEAATAYGTVLPQITDVQTALAGEPLVNPNYNFNQNSTAILLADLSVSNTAADTSLHSYQSALTLNFDISKIANPEDLLISFLHPVLGSALSTGDNLIFSLNVNNTLSESFSFSADNISNAFDIFNGKTLDLGTLTSLADANHLLNLVFSLELNSTTNLAGLDLGLFVGSSTIGSGIDPTPTVPLPSGVWLLISGLMGWLGLTQKKTKTL
ncbi:MAG: hypothetical protein WC782_00935 [Methylococcaceae bacterium]|jgi:hypothetical protein